MAKDPAFLFYSSDFLTGTMLMTNEQVGKYIRLICLQHQKGHLNEKDMMNICKTRDEDIFEKFVKDDNGLYYNERCEQEVLKRKNFCLSRSKNRSSASQVTEKQSKTKRKKTSKTYVKHMENEDEKENANETVIENKTELEKAFDEWVAMRKKMKDGITERAIELGKSELRKLSGGIEQTAIEIINQSILNSWKGFFPLKQQNGTNQKGQPKNDGAMALANGILSGEISPDVLERFKF